MDRRRAGCALDFFWEQADLEANSDDPLELELSYRLDALARYRTMLSDMEGTGREDLIDAIVDAHDREQVIIRRLRQAIDRRRTRVPL